MPTLDKVIFSRRRPDTFFYTELVCVGLGRRLGLLKKSSVLLVACLRFLMYCCCFTQGVSCYQETMEIRLCAKTGRMLIRQQKFVDVLVAMQQSLDYI